MITAVPNAVIANGAFVMLIHVQVLMVMNGVKLVDR